jgi:phospholipase/lecithinase/hemolysin
LFRAGLALLTTDLLVVAAAAGPFSSLVVFGDSLSDVGNVSQATASIPFIPTTPGPYYYNGRFSNGPVYAESLASGLGLPAVVHSRAGGKNFAHGGAMTSGTSFPTNIVVRDVDDQVGDFLAGGAADANALFVLFAGANDLLDTQTNVNVPVNNLAEDFGRLVAAGARQFLVPNLPLLGYTPRFNGNSTTRAQYNTRTTSYNNVLDAMLDVLETGNPALTIFRLDVAGLFNQAIANPAAFGLTNVTQAAAPGLEPGASSYNTNQIAANANQYLFWDDLHPTATVHAALAQAALDLLLSTPGDFNNDGSVDAADYVVWRDGLGTTRVPDEYDEWRANFGNSTGAVAVAGTVAVPEPATLALIAVAAALLVARRYSSSAQTATSPSSSTST